MKEFIDKLISRLEEKHKESENCPKFEKVFRQVAFEESIDIVNELVEEYKGGWIPCKESMPSKDGNYLVCDAQGYIYISRYYEGSTTFNRNVGFVARAWQPLPAPYTEGEAELYRAKSVDGEYQEYKGDWK